jgi:hypothetical protein
MTVSKPETVEVTQALAAIEEIIARYTGDRRSDDDIRYALNTAKSAVLALPRHRLNATPSRQDGLREALKDAYTQGALDVHNYWLKNPGEAPRGDDPEFGEAASDYATAALSAFNNGGK